ncbi:peptidylprolyl isomerase [Massilia sp. YIM B04103]|uniref:peptidylprolyl isomerase n=1 Tax=Massilia sp. YIM B04103 TaxID=2963106 RepID=UPI00210B131B|nr:peptidylprolyl isomerase [Massilia sp. YIM B04103]
MKKLSFNPRPLLLHGVFALLAGSGAFLPALQPAAQAVTEFKLNDPVLAARIDGAPVQAFSVEAMWQLARLKDSQASRTEALESIVANRLLAASARKTYGEAALHANQRVAFAREVTLDEQLLSTLRAVYGKELDLAVQRQPGGKLDALITAQSEPDGAALDAVFGKSDALRLEHVLNPAQLERAKKVTLLRYQLQQGAAGSISLYDVYQRQNVQGRVALFTRQPGFALQQARQHLASFFVQQWVRQRFGEAALADLRQVLSEQQEVVALQQMHGIGADTDSASPVVDQLAKQVKPAQIAAYYRKHREEFERIEKIKARHIRLPDEAAAQSVAKALASGGDFAALAKRHSSAADAASGGDLGWIRHEAKLDWLAQMAFAQPEGQVSKPIRMPAGPHDKASWEIVLVEKRVNGYQAPDSESVRYVASQAIARDAAVEQLSALRVRLLREARIDINRSLLDKPASLLENKS